MAARVAITTSSDTAPSGESAWLLDGAPPRLGYSDRLDMRAGLALPLARACTADPEPTLASSGVSFPVCKSFRSSLTGFFFLPAAFLPACQCKVHVHLLLLLIFSAYSLLLLSAFLLRPLLA